MAKPIHYSEDKLLHFQAEGYFREALGRQNTLINFGKQFLKLLESYDKFLETGEKPLAARGTPISIPRPWFGRVKEMISGFESHRSLTKKISK